MNEECWQRVEDLFHETLGLDPAQRSAFLEQACGQDAELRAEVEALLVHDDRAQERGFLAAASDDPNMPDSSVEGPPGKDDGMQSSPSPGVYPRIDGLQIIREIGRGGMGIVYEAEDQRLNRRVALKLMPFNALVLPKQVERFKREAQAAARLHHTNIVPVFGVGKQAGYHFYLMQYIEGFGLDAVLDQLRRFREAAPGPREAIASETVNGPIPPDHSNPPANPCPSSVTVADVARSLVSGQFGENASPPLGESPTDDGSGETAVFPPPIVASEFVPSDPPPVILPGSGEISTQSDLKRPYFRAVARIGVQVAEALEYANRQGILHRDIKPSNLLLDIRGNTWVADFGLAKTLGADDLTATGDIVGTVRYMAPERFRGQCDARADVYSLGLSLYESAALGPAFEEGDRFHLIERIRHEGPPRLATRAPKVPRDLETIIHKAISHDPAQRYTTAGAMANDLRRFLDGRIILARRASLFERAVRWCRRNPWVAASIAILVIGTVVSAWQAVRATSAGRTARSAAEATIKALGKAESEAIRATQAEAATRTQRDRAQAEAAISKAVNEFVQQDMLAQASAFNLSTLRTQLDPDLKIRTALDRAAQKIGDRFASQPLVEASIRQTVGETYYQLGFYKEALPHLQRALDLRRTILGNDDPDTLLAMKALGLLYYDDSKLPEAEPLLVEAMKGLRKARDSQHRDLLDAMTLVGVLYYSQRRYPEAERLLTQVRDALRVKQGSDDPETLQVTNILAMVYLEQKQTELAERTLADVLDRMQRVLGLKHPLTSIVRQNLSDVYQSEGKKNEAMRLLVNTIEAQSKMPGREHPSTLLSLVKLGMLYAERGILDKAEPLLSEALVGCRKSLDRNHETTVAALAGLASIYAQKRDMRQLGRALMEAAEIARIKGGLVNITTAQANQCVGMFFLVQREYGKAEPFLRDCLTYWVKDNPTHGDRFFNELQYGISLLAQRKCPEAKPHFLVGYNGIKASREHAPPPEDADLGWLIEQVGQLRGADGRPFNETTTMALLHRDPALQAIVFDLQFPEDPFAPK
jgi:serine/threonine protein kinase